MDNIIEYILGAVLLLFGSREVWNFFAKKNLKKKLDGTLNELDVEKLRNVAEKTKTSGDKYHDLRDQYRSHLDRE